MKVEKKIFVKKNDSFKEIKKEISNTSAGRIILNIPKKSKICEKVENFEEIKSEAIEKNKELLIESTDNEVIELARTADIKILNPTQGINERTMFDILPKTRKEEIMRTQKILDEKIITIKRVTQKNLKEAEKEEPIHIIDERERRIEEIYEKEEPETKQKKIKKFNIRKGSNILWKKRIIFGPIAIIIVCAGLYSWFILPKATIVLATKKNPVEFTEIIEVSSKATNLKTSDNKIIIPGELFTSNKNMEMIFSANGKENFQQKATGTLTIYNAYSASPQVLVATTRFESPDGKIFRIDKKITIPGAKTTNGKIVPSQIDAVVSADASGDAYNINPTSGWKIPGFKGTPRYEGFYAENKQAMSGGFSGQRAVVSNEEKITNTNTIDSNLQDALKAEIAILMSDQFKLFKEASSFQITRREERSLQNDQNKFEIYVEGEMKQLVFKEDALKNALIAKIVGSDNTNIKADQFEFSYGKPEVNLSEGKMTFEVKGTAVLMSDIKEENVIQQIKGKTESDLHSIIASLPGIENANISLFPFWVHNVPNLENRIFISIK